MDNPGRFGAWANGPIDDIASSGGTSTSASPTSGTNNSALVGGGDMVPQWSDVPTPESGGGSGNTTTRGSGNGGSYGVGGQGPGGFNPRTGTFSFDDGGEVDPGNDGDEDDQQLPGGNSDPMSVIQNALGWGRQQMGLPRNFSDPQQQEQPQQGYDDGGVIPEQPQQEQQQQGNGAQLPDPRRTMAYLAGAGNIPPDAAAALEQRVDPQGQMDPAERKLAAITAAGNPQAQFGLMQHYRTLFNAHSAAAQAMLDRGNLAQAAQHATEAMSNVPNGNSVRFAPAKGGLAMHSKPIGQQQGFGEGGAVDTDNPSVMMKSYKSGGVVQAFDNAGEVEGAQEDTDEDDDTGSPVIPNEATSNPVTDVTPQPRAEPDGATPTPTGPVDLSGQVKSLSMDDVKKMLQDGWDKLTESWNGMVDNAADARAGAAVARQQMAQVGPAVNRMLGGPGEQPHDVDAALSADNKGVIPSDAPQSQVGARQQANAVFNNANMGAGKLTPRPTPGYRGTPDQGGQSPAQPDTGLSKYRAQANDIYGGWQSNAPQRQKFMADAARADQQNTARLEQMKASYGPQGKLGLEQFKQGSMGDRAAAHIAAQLQIAAQRNNTALNDAQVKAFTSFVGGQINADPSIAKDPQQIMKLVAPFMGQAQKLGLTPQNMVQMIQSAPTGQTQGAQAPQQQGAQAPGSDLQSNQPKKMFNGKAYTKEEWNALQQRGQ
jgi:hypothetical protein